MNKKEVQQRVLQNGSPLALDKFSWDQKTKTFSSLESGLVIDFSLQSNCTFNTGAHCTFNTWSYCTFNTGLGCTFNTWSYCTFNTGAGCTFKTGTHCTFNTGAGCTFNTWSYCTFNTGLGCTFNTGAGCTFKTGSDCVIVRRDVFSVIQPQKDEVIQICPRNIPFHLVNGFYKGQPYIIADGIVSGVVSQKGNIFRVINYGDTKPSYLIKSGDVYSHGATLKEARESLIYKISDRDTSKYDGMTLDSVVTLPRRWRCIAPLRELVRGVCVASLRIIRIRKKTAIQLRS